MNSRQLPDHHRLPYRSRPLQHSSRVLLPLERLQPSTTFQPRGTSPSVPCSRKSTMKTQRVQFSEHKEEEPRASHHSKETGPGSYRVGTSQAPDSADNSIPPKATRKTQHPHFSEHREEERMRTSQQSKDTGPANCRTGTPLASGSAGNSIPPKATRKTQHPHFSESSRAATPESCTSRPQTLDSQEPSNEVMESSESFTKTAESDMLESVSASVTFLTSKGCRNTTSPLFQAHDMVDPSTPLLDEGTISPTSEHDEVFAPEMPFIDEESLSKFCICLEMPTLLDTSGENDDDRLHLKTETVSKTAIDPEITCQDGADALHSDIILKECDVSQCWNVPGVRIRTENFNFCSAARREERGLQPVSDPQLVLIRVRGSSNLFVIKNSNVPSISTISQDRLGQAVFQKQEFFDERLCKVVTSFCHLPSRCYLGISADAKDVTFTRSASSESEDGDDAFVVSLNDPSRPARAPNMPEGDSSGPDPCCLFLVMNDGYNSIQPATCHDSSLDVSPSDDRLRVVPGRQWSFKLLPADQTLKYVSKADLKKLMKKTLLCVLVVSRRPQH